jgi:hypothetical protein
MVDSILAQEVGILIKAGIDDSRVIGNSAHNYPFGPTANFLNLEAELEVLVLGLDITNFY